jgi:hypothetical protein
VSKTTADLVRDVIVMKPLVAAWGFAGGFGE